MFAVTSLGDDAVTGSLALAITAYLLIAKQKKAALTMALSFVFAVAILALGKIVLYNGCVKSAFFDLRSPSAHSALSLVICGLLAAFVSTSLIGWRRVIPYFVAAPLIALIAVSRFWLGIHTKSDVVFGLATGLAVSMVVWRLFMREEVVRCSWKKVLLILLAVLATTYGAHFSAEQMLALLSRSLRDYNLTC
jgi:undecaprenyl-diphosphatase